MNGTGFDQIGRKPASLGLTKPNGSPSLITRRKTVRMNPVAIMDKQNSTAIWTSSTERVRKVCFTVKTPGTMSAVASAFLRASSNL